LSLILREEDILQVFEKRALRVVLWPKKDKVMGDQRRLHND
jgi:hypothetical protein